MPGISPVCGGSARGFSEHRALADAAGARARKPGTRTVAKGKCLPGVDLFGLREIADSAQVDLMIGLAVADGHIWWFWAAPWF